MTMFEIILTAMFTGVGVTVGTFLANKILIRNIEKIVKITKTKNNKVEK